MTYPHPFLLSCSLHFLEYPVVTAIHIIAYICVSRANHCKRERKATSHEVATQLSKLSFASMYASTITHHPANGPGGRFSTSSTRSPNRMSSRRITLAISLLMRASSRGSSSRSSSTDRS